MLQSSMLHGTRDLSHADAVRGHDMPMLPEGGYRFLLLGDV